MSEDDKDVMKLDQILVEEVGQCGKFQLRVVLLCASVAMMGGLDCYSYLFTLVKVKTRCAIPECENSSASTTFSPPWILDALPAVGDTFDNCHRYATSISIPINTSSCPVNLFDRNSVIQCEGYVYEHNNSAYVEFNLACDDWRPTLVGSAKLFALMISLPISGILADRWGRRFMMTLSAFSIPFFGVMLYFTESYITFILISFVQVFFAGGSFSCAYILAMEYVGPKHRVVTGIIMSTFVGIGQTLLGLIAWTQPYWRHLILIIFVPQLITVTYFWIAPESVRWLMSNGRYEKSLVILEKAAKMNGNALSERTLTRFTEAKKHETKEKHNSDPWLLCLVFKHKAILLRCLVTPLWWITCIFIYYGLTISSVGISGNKYINYSASTAIEIPGYWIAMLLLDRIGRKPLLIAEFWICAACQITYIFISVGPYWLSLMVYLLGKMSIAATVTSLYVYTAELYPTRYRTSLLSYSSMIGRIGGIAAPLMPGLAAKVWDQLPFALFGGMALLAGLLVLLTPETLGQTLPDTMQEAAQLSKDSPSTMKQYLRTLVFRRKMTSFNVTTSSIS